MPSAPTTQNDSRPTAGSPSSDDSLARLLEQAAKSLARDRLEDARDQLQRALTASGLPRKAFENHPSLPEVYSGLALAHLALGSPREALKLLETARRRFPADLAILCVIARAHLQLGNDRDAAAVARRVLRQNRRNLDANIVLAELLRRDGKHQEAVTLCEKILQIDKTRHEVYEILSNAHESLGLHNDALKTLENGIRYLPRSRRRLAMFRLAGLQRRVGHLQPAERTLRSLLRYKEDRARTHILLAELLLELRRCDESVKHSLSALEIDPRNVAAYNLLALAHVRRGAFGQAIRAAEGAVEAAPMEAFQRFKLATLYHQKGDLARAVQQYQRLLDFHPSSEFESETHEALAAIEQYQFQEIMIRCMEDSVFRIKLQRDAERTISEYGYVASDGLMSLIRSVDIDELNDMRPASKPTRYH